uniref:Uncharacterized protein n=1 Tax=Nannochloropsis oculata TaxID=43925 RepID=A0A023PKE5_9STRA|nr:hypothetical protein Naoc00026 [Nannochloropsis oculata]
MKLLKLKMISFYKIIKNNFTLRNRSKIGTKKFKV